MEMAYGDRWKAEIAEMRRVLAGFAMKEECKSGKPTYTVDGKNIVIMQGFKEYFGLGFFQAGVLFGQHLLNQQPFTAHAFADDMDTVITGSAEGLVRVWTRRRADPLF